MGTFHVARHLASSRDTSSTQFSSFAYMSFIKSCFINSALERRKLMLERESSKEKVTQTALTQVASSLPNMNNFFLFFWKLSEFWSLQTSESLCEYYFYESSFISPKGQIHH